MCGFVRKPHLRVDLAPGGNMENWWDEASGMGGEAGGEARRGNVCPRFPKKLK